MLSFLKSKHADQLLAIGFSPLTFEGNAERDRQERPDPPDLQHCVRFVAFTPRIVLLKDETGHRWIYHGFIDLHMLTEKGFIDLGARRLQTVRQGTYPTQVH